MTPDQIIELINGAISPSNMSVREAIDFLEEIGSHIEAHLECLEQENQRES